MSIIQILVRTGILLVSSIVQVFSVTIGGLGKLLVAVAEYLDMLQQKLLNRLNKPKKTKKPETRETIDMPL